MAHLTPLDRQVAESINIMDSGKVPQESLNSKTEWGGAKIPSILVTKPKRVAAINSDKGEKEEEETESEEWRRLQAAVRRGHKRLRYVEAATVPDIEVPRENMETGEP